MPAPTDTNTDAPVVVRLAIPQGATWRRRILHTYHGSGDPIPANVVSSVRMQIRDQPGGELLLDLGDDAGEITVADGYIDVLLTDEQSALLAYSGYATWDVLVSYVNGEKHFVGRGDSTLTRRTTLT